MDVIELLDIVKKGEDSRTQFKESIQSADSLAVEITAFANTKGGQLIIGVSDTGDIKGLSTEEVAKINQMISNVCTQKIEPQISVETENIAYGDRVVIVINVPLGPNKFYIANGRDIWVKVGADKRRARREELQRLLQESQHFYADEQPVEGTGLADLEMDLLRQFIERKTGLQLEELDLPLTQLMENMKLMKNGECTLAGLLLFNKGTLRQYDFQTIGAMSWYGNEISTNEYRESENIKGNFRKLYKEGKAFILRQLRKIQKSESPNVLGVLEIPEIAIEEALINALVHRNYFIASYVRINVFDNRVEIISPGNLPNTLTVDTIKLGVHITRNPIILSYIKDIPDIPYRGMGTGVARIMKSCREAGVAVDFINDEETEQFKVIFWRNNYHQINS
ncbi:MAG: ATP-dependent helicase RecG [Clostridia bacterium]|nr:ATP-dependent helicase RecG [Clostridia bacterium]